MKKIFLFLLICLNMNAFAGVKESLDSIFEARYPHGDTEPGAAVIIAHNDSIIYERYFGLADVEARKPVTASTMFNIASVSKQFTVVALMQQHIDLDTPVSHLFNYPQPFYKRVTLRHLASHTSGVPDVRRTFLDRAGLIACNDSMSLLNFEKAHKLEFEPGTDYNYLNPSFVLLSKVVEMSSGQEFGAYMHDHIFAPAGMTSARYFSPEGMPDDAAHAYIIDANGQWEQFEYGKETCFATRGDGGIYATARDMLRWERALATGTLIGHEQLQEAYTPHIATSNSKWCDYQRRPNTHYGLGWFVEKRPGKPVTVFHTGDNGGFQAYVAKYPAHGISIIVLENRNDLDRWAMATALDQALNL